MTWIRSCAINDAVLWQQRRGRYNAATMAMLAVHYAQRYYCSSWCAAVMAFTSICETADNYLSLTWWVSKICQSSVLSFVLPFTLYPFLAARVRNFYLYLVNTRYIPGKFEGKHFTCPYPDPLRVIWKRVKLLYCLYMNFLRDYYDAASSYSYTSTVVHVHIGNFSDNSVCSRYYSEGKEGKWVKSRGGGNFTLLLHFTSLLAQIRDTR